MEIKRISQSNVSLTEDEITQALKESLKVIVSFSK
jgi:hypothetical protein